MRSNWKRATAVLDFDQDQLTALIQPAFPKSKVVNWQQCEGGLANTNIRLHLSNREDPILLRLFARDPKQAEKEWAINQMVGTAVPSPQYFHFSPTNPISNHPYIVMEWINAERLENVIFKMSAAEIEQTGKSLGECLANVHKFKFDCAGFFDVQLSISQSIDIGGAGLQEYVKRTLSGRRARERIGDALSNRLIDFLKENACALDQWQEKPCLVHADFGGSNILVTRKSGDWTVAAILDWEFAFSGSPFFDFGNLLREPVRSLTGFTEALEEGYQQSGGELPLDWLALSRLVDLTAWMEFVSREDPGEAVIDCARRNISQTIDHWRPNN